MSKPLPEILYVVDKVVPHGSPEYWAMAGHAMQGNEAFGIIPVYADEEKMKAAFPDTPFKILDSRMQDIKHEDLKVDPKLK